MTSVDTSTMFPLRNAAATRAQYATRGKVFEAASHLR